MKNFNTMGGSQKNPIFRGSNEKPMWEFPKKGAKKRRVVFLRGG